MSAPVFVQGKTVTFPTPVSTTSVQLAFTNGQAAGNCNLVAIGFRSTPPIPSILTVTDSAGNIYDIVCPSLYNSQVNQVRVIYAAKNIAAFAAGNTVTVTWDIPGTDFTQKNVQILEYAGASKTAPIDVFSQNNTELGGSQLTPTCPAVTTTKDNGTIVSFLDIQFPPGGLAVPTGFTSRLSDNEDFAADGPAAAIGSYSTKWTMTVPVANTVTQVVLVPPFVPSFVQSNTAASSTSTQTVAASFTNAQPAGNCIVVCVSFAGSAPNISSVSDTAFNTYTVALPELFEPLYSRTQAVYVAKNINASAIGNTVTVSLTAARTTKNIQILEYATVGLVTPLDGASQTDSTLGDNGLSPTPPGVATTKPNDVIVGFLNIQSANTVTVPNGFTSRIATTLDFAADGPATAIGTYFSVWHMTNARSNIVSQILLTPPLAAAFVQTLPANFIQSSNATLNGRIISGGSSPIISYGLEWGTTTAYGNVITNPGPIGNVVFNAVISGLSPSTKYHFRAFATTAVATSQSADTFLKTPAVTTHGPVTGNFTGGSETFSLNLSFQDEFDSPFSQYDPATNTGGTWRTWFYYGVQQSATSRVEGSVSCVFSDINYNENRFQPFLVSGSNLTITATNNPNYPALSGQPFISGTITTQNSFNSQTYGYYECRCQTVPMGVGIWPAFWMLQSTNNIAPNNDSNEEIDIMECFAVTNSVSATLHKRNETPYSQGKTEAINDTRLFHTYGMLWTPTNFYFYIDDVQSATMVNPATSGFHTPHYVIVTLQTGASGSFLGIPTQSEIPINMVIDYVRVYSTSLAISAQVIIR